MELIDMLAVIIAGVVVAGGQSFVSHALFIVGVVIVVLGAIHISCLEG